MTAPGCGFVPRFGHVKWACELNARIEFVVGIRYGVVRPIVINGNGSLALSYRCACMVCARRRRAALDRARPHPVRSPPLPLRSDRARVERRRVTQCLRERNDRRRVV